MDLLDYQGQRDRLDQRAQRDKLVRLESLDQKVQAEQPDPRDRLVIVVSLEHQAMLAILVNKVHRVRWASQARLAAWVQLGLLDLRVYRVQLVLPARLDHQVTLEHPDLKEHLDLLDRLELVVVLVSAGRLDSQARPGQPVQLDSLVQRVRRVLKAQREPLVIRVLLGQRVCKDPKVLRE